MSVVKNQHFVPRVYLKKFASDAEQIWVLNKETSKLFSANVKNVACEKYFYDIPQKYAQNSDNVQIVEKALSRIEARFAQCRDDILSAVEGGGWFSDELKQEFASHIGLQISRTKTQRNELSELRQKFDQKPRSDTSADQDVCDHARLMFSPESKDQTKTALLKCIWYIEINQSDKSFITSDVPVVYNRSLGINSSKIEINFPLSPKHVLSIEGRSKYAGIAVRENIAYPVVEQRVRRLNVRQICESDRQIYSDRPDFNHAIDYLKQRPEFTRPNRDRLENQNTAIHSVVEPS
jgi:hypothetical protein